MCFSSSHHTVNDIRALLQIQSSLSTACCGDLLRGPQLACTGGCGELFWISTSIGSGKAKYCLKLILRAKNQIRGPEKWQKNKASKAAFDEIKRSTLEVHGLYSIWRVLVEVLRTFFALSFSLALYLVLYSFTALLKYYFSCLLPISLKVYVR